MKQRTTYWLVGGLVVVLLIVGVLHGWFRDRTGLAPAQVTTLQAAERSNRSSSSAQQEFSTLWKTHVSRTRTVIVSEFNKSSTLEADVAALLQNQQDIAAAVDRYYPGSKEVIAGLFTEHIAVAKDILDDLRDLRLARLPSDINKWYTNADQIAEALMILNGAWNMKAHMHAHLRITEREAIYEWLGLDGTSKSIYEQKIVSQAEDMAMTMAAGL